MGEIEIFQLHIADVIGVWHLDLILVFLGCGLAGLRVRYRSGSCPCFRPIPCFGLHRFGKDILLFKQHSKISRYLFRGKSTLMQRRQNGDQNIGIMLDIVQIITVFIIAGI